MNGGVSKTENGLNVFLRPVTTVEIFYAQGILDRGSEGSYDEAVRIARGVPASRIPFQVPEQFRDLENFENYRRIVEDFPYSDDTNVEFRDPERINSVVSQAREHIDPATSLRNNRANCKGISTLAVVLGRYMGIPSRYVQYSPDHITFELNMGGVWAPRDLRDFDQGGSVFDSVGLPEKDRFDQLYTALLHEVNRLSE